VAAATVGLVQPRRPAPALAEALFRLHGELLAIGFEVEVVDAPSSEARGNARRTWLQRMETERKLDALIEVLGEPDPVAAEIWIYQQRSRRFELARVTLEPDAQDAAETLAIRAIEVLRSSFLELDLAARQPPLRSGSPPERAAPEKAAPAHPARLGLEAGAGVLIGFDGVGPSMLPVVRFDWAASSSLVLQATLSGLGTQPTIESAAGSARVAQSQGVLGLCYCSPSELGVRPFLALAGGVLRTSVQGQAESPRRGEHVVKWSALLEGSVGARLRLSDRYYLTLASHVQLAAPYVAIHFVDQLVATSGRPNLLFTLTAGTWL
jgi:hypothetical protein